MLPAGLHIESGWADEERKKQKEKEKGGEKIEMVKIANEVKRIKIKIITTKIKIKVN